MDDDIVITANDYDTPIKIVFTHKCKVCETELSRYKSSFDGDIYNMESITSVSGVGNKIVKDKLYCKKCDKWY